MHIAIITAGGAGMFCGSCMHDNAWARALMQAGHRVTLIPTYTPIRVDEASLAMDRVFFGGINVYLEARWRWWRWVPRWMKSWLDKPAVISFFANRMGSIGNSAEELGDLTLSMLAGESGPLRSAGDELASFVQQLAPDAVIFSNALLCGALKRIKESYAGPVFCMLQGDDLFLEELPLNVRPRVLQMLTERALQFDRMLTHSEFYADRMSQYLTIPRERFAVIPLSIHASASASAPTPVTERPFTIGYFARLAPEKGLQHLIDAYELFRQRHPRSKLLVGGYLHERHRAWFDQLRKRTEGWGEEFQYLGSPETSEAKQAFYASIDLLSVPTDFLEPKGLYVLEALAMGVPVVQPDHGAFPEVLSRTRGGRLVPPKDPEALAAAWADFAADPELRARHSAWGAAGVREWHSPEVLSKITVDLIESHVQERLPRSTSSLPV